MQFGWMLTIFAVLLAAVQSQLFTPDEATEDMFEPDVRFLKRNSLSNMMRLGKRADKKACEDCNLGNLMRIGRR